MMTERRSAFVLVWLERLWQDLRYGCRMLVGMDQYVRVDFYVPLMMSPRYIAISTLV